MSSTHKNGIFLYKYYENRIDSFLVHLDKTQSDLSSEAIHDIRVDVKKIRCFYLLLEMLERKKFNSNEHFTIFDELFKRAGNIRELNVNRELWNKYIFPDDDTTGLIEFIESDMKTSVNHYKINLKNFNFKKLNISDAEILKICSSISREMIIKKSRSFISREFKRVNKIYYEGKSVKRFHKIRKSFRTLREIMDLLLLFDPDKKIRNFRKQLKLMEDNLGNWHDRMVLVNSLNKFIRAANANKSELIKKVLPVIKKDVYIFIEKQNFIMLFN